MDLRVSIPPGQQQARNRWNTRESGAAFDRKKTPYLTEKAQQFIAEQSFFVMSGQGLHNELDGLLVMGSPGFVQVPGMYTCLLRLEHTFSTTRIVERLLYSSQYGQHSQLGLFFIRHATRERLCVQGKAEPLLDRAFTSFFPSIKSIWVLLHVQQAFFHCVKYIRTRVPGFTSPITQEFEQTWRLRDLHNGSQQYLSEEACAFIRQQLLCFLCTVDRHGRCAVNHRGGTSGFLVPLPPGEQFPGGIVLLPDYAGNGAFEAIGNILETGQATLIIPCYPAHQALRVSGVASVLEMNELSADLARRCIGAERVVALAVQRVELQHGDWSTTIAYERNFAESLSAFQKPVLVCP